MSNLLHKKQIGSIFVTFFSLLLFLVPAVTHANVVTDKIGELLFYLANAIGGSVLFLGALMLDTAIFKLVIQMGTLFDVNHPLGQAVTTGWVLIRDLINMTFIFGLIYIGIKTILNSEDSGTRKQLGLLIAAALLINFSLFMTQLMVDFSNLLATQIYAQLVSGNEAPNASGAANAHTKTRSPISSKFLTTIQMSGLLNEDALNGGGKAIEGTNLIFFSLLLLLFYCLAGFAFLMGSITILTRFIALLLFMIFSPVVFMGWILPHLGKYSEQWWENFWKYIFYAPLYIFMLYLSLQVLAGLTKSSTALSNAASAKELGNLVGKGATVGFAEIVMIFLIMIGLLWASLKIGEKLGIAGGKMAMSGFNRTVKGAGASASAFAYRNSIGRGANWMRDKYDEKNARMDGKLDKFGGRTLRRTMTTTRDYGAFGGRSLDATDKIKKEAGGIVDKTQRRQFLLDNDLSNISKASSSELTGFADESSTKKQILAKAGSLSSTQMKTLLDSDKLTEAEKIELKKNNKEQLIAMVKDPAKAKELFDKVKKPSDIAKLPPEVLKDPNAAKYLVDTGVLSQIAQSEDLSATDRQAILGNMWNATEDLGEDKLNELQRWVSTDRNAKRFRV